MKSTKYLLLILTSILLLVSQVDAQDTPVITPVYSSFARGTTVIPRFHDGENFPARNLEGGVYVGTPETVGAVVVSQDYNKPMDQWTGGTYGSDGKRDTSKAPAWLNGRVDNVTIDGRGGISRLNPSVYPDGVTYDGIILNGNGYRVDRLRVFDVPGTAGVFKRVVRNRWGPPKLWDQGNTILSNLTALAVLRGFDLQFVDGQVRNINVSAFRDWGVKVHHAIMYSQVHTWGGRGPGIWQSGVRCQGSQLYAESGPVGIKIDGGGNRLTQIYTHTCWVNDVDLNGSGNHLSDFEFRVDKLGVAIDGQYNTLTDGEVEAKNGTVGIQVGGNGGNGLTIRNVSLSMWGQSEAIGFTTDVKLSNCDLDFLIVGGAVGVDLTGPNGESRIGWGNTINIRRSGSDPKSQTTEVIRLPATWSKSNHIYVNGIEKFPEVIATPGIMPPVVVEPEPEPEPVVVESGLLGDYNNNGEVDAADYTAWQDAMTARSTTLLNDPTPGTVDGSDYLYWQSHFGETVDEEPGETP